MTGTTIRLVGTLGKKKFNFFFFWIKIPVVPARGGAEVALDLIIRPFSSIEFARAVRRACLLCTNLLHCCCPRTWPAWRRRATTLQCNIKRIFSSHFTLHFSHPALHASHLHFTFHSSSYLKSSDFFSPHVTSSDLFSSHPIPSHISSKQVLLNYFHVIRALKRSSQLISAPRHARKLLPTKLAQSTSQYYFVLQSLHRSLPNTTSYYKACTTYFPALLRTTKSCTTCFPVLLRTTKFAQITSEYYFVLQSLHMSNHLIFSDICPITSSHPIFPTHRQPESFFVFAPNLGVGNAFGPHWHERVSYLLNPSARMAGHEAKQVRNFHHPQCSHYNAFCNVRFPTRISRCTWQHKTTTIMQPLHCDLQPENQETYRTTHTWTTTHCRTQRRNQSRLVRPQPHPPHTRGTFHRRPEPLYTEKHKVSCPGFPPKRGPCNMHAAMTMRFATSGSQPASLDAHGNTKRQRSCSHYTAICNQRVKKRIELRTREQPLIAEHKGGTNRAWSDPSRTRRTHEVPFIAGRSHFTTGKTQGFLPRLSPKTKPM